MRRNKRCLLAYHRVRSDKLEEMCWKGDDIMDQRQVRQEPSEGANLGSESGNKISLSPEEGDYVRRYADMLAAYKGQWTATSLLMCEY